MFKHILLPLDGSRLAEAAIPLTADLAEKLNAQVTLLHVIEKNAPRQIHGQHHLVDDEEACRYLAKIEQERFPQALKVESHVHSEEVSEVARSIVEHSGEFTPDLIVLSAHGAGGLRDLVVGSIAQQVIASGSVPVLLLKPDEEGRIHYTGFTSLLVALDGDPVHETSLQVAAELAAGLDIRIHLLRVVPTLGTLNPQDAASGTLLPAATSAMLDIEEEDAACYLQEKVDGLRETGIAVTAEVVRGDPAQEVIKSASQQDSSIIVLGTHGKKGMNAFWAGSVAPRIVASSTLPVLLVPVRR